MKRRAGQGKRYLRDQEEESDRGNSSTGARAPEPGVGEFPKRKCGHLEGLRWAWYGDDWGCGYGKGGF